MVATVGKMINKFVESLLEFKFRDSLSFHRGCSVVEYFLDVELRRRKFPISISKHFVVGFVDAENGE